MVRVFFCLVPILLLANVGWTQTEPAMDVYPNPFDTKLHIQVDHLDEDTVTLEMYDIEGHAVGDFFENVVLSNQLHITYYGDSLPDGIYFVRTIINDSAQMRKVMKVDGITTGITSTNDPAGIKLYPVPAREVLYIDAEQEVISFKLYNVQGREVAKYKGQTSLSVAGLPAGNYLVEIEMQDGGVVRKKIVVQ